MDQSESNNSMKKTEKEKIELPKKGFSLEFFVGLFAILGLAATGYLAIGLGGMEIFGSDKYEIRAEFDNISGLKSGASVEIAGVPIGEVSSIVLDDPRAIVTLRIADHFRIRDDDVASIRTKGILGDKYVQISRGASDFYIEEGGMIIDTQSVIDIEDLIGKFVHNFGDGD